jgi:transcriptional regulator GlxA family with amidase domain
MSYRCKLAPHIIPEAMNFIPARLPLILRFVSLLVVGVLIGWSHWFARAVTTESPPIKVAFVLTQDADVIDLTGPWEVFPDAHEIGGLPMFQLFTVGESTAPVTMSGGLHAVPNYTFADAPHPDIIVVGAQRGGPALTEWLQSRGRDTRVMMSVCTGAYKLARAGLLDGKKATTHNEYWDEFGKMFPKVQLERGPRFVQGDDQIYTAGGLTSGIDLALHIVEKFGGREVANKTAEHMEYKRLNSPQGE